MKYLEPPNSKASRRERRQMEQSQAGQYLSPSGAVSVENPWCVLPGNDRNNRHEFSIDGYVFPEFGREDHRPFHPHLFLPVGIALRVWSRSCSESGGQRHTLTNSALTVIRPALSFHTVALGCHPPSSPSE